MKRTILPVLLLALLLAAAPAPAKELEPLDYTAYFELLPEMQKISELSNHSIVTLHGLVRKLEQTVDDDQAAGIRTEIRQVLLEHRAMKNRMIELVNKVLKKEEPKLSNKDALRALRNTTLRRVAWNNVFLKYVHRDIAQAIGVPIVLNQQVQELNQIELSFDEISADAVMQIILNNFDLHTIIYDGEIWIVRRLNPNEKRFLKWEEKHGKVDWIAEDAEGTYEDLEVPEAKRKLLKVEDMDLPFLLQKMTKIYILEGESERHELRLRELQMLAHSEVLYGDEPKSEEERLARIKRHKHILWYLKMEKENSIEVWDVINKVLGERLTLDGDDAEIRRLLSTEVSLIEWQDKDLEEALYELGRIIGVPVEVDLPPFVEMAVSLTVENVTVETVISLICDIHPMDWRYVDGRLFFAHLQSD